MSENIELVITVDQILALLNDALGLDREAVTKLFNNRVKCNQELADHPTIQVGWMPIDGSFPEPNSPNVDDGNSEIRFGVLGLLNGFLGVREDGWGYISAVYDEPGGLITKFERTQNPRLVKQS